MAASEEKEEKIKDLICLKVQIPRTHMSPKNIEKYTGISRSSVRKMVKRKGLKQLKCLKTPGMSECKKKGSTGRASVLVERYGKKLQNH